MSIAIGYMTIGRDLLPAILHEREIIACPGCTQGVLADVSIATGYMTIGAMLAGRFVFQRLGWAPAAFVTPTVLLVFGGAFFGFSLSGLPAAASWAVLAGAITQVRACLQGTLSASHITPCLRPVCWEIW